MRLKNYTDLDTDLIRRIIRAVRPPGIANFDIGVKNNDGAGRGRAYTGGTSYHDRHCPYIVVAVAKTEKQARSRWTGHGGYLPWDCGNRVENFLFILAHELRHLWQKKVKRGRRVWGARGQFSEKDADAYALQMLRRFRRGELDLRPLSEVEEVEETKKAA